MALTAVVLGATTACGTGSSGDESTATTPEPAATDASSDNASTDAEPTATDAPAAADATDASSEDAVADDGTGDDETAVAEPEVPPADQTPAEPAEAGGDAVTAEPEPAPIGGRTFATTLDPASDFEDNPFPDLVVDDVTRDQQLNIRNIFPAERPVVLWGWAPH